MINYWSEKKVIKKDDYNGRLKILIIMFVIKHLKMNQKWTKPNSKLWLKCWKIFAFNSLSVIQ